MALARSFADRIDKADMQRSWTKVPSGPKTVRKPITPRPMDDLPVELQWVGEALVESRSKPIPPEAGYEFPGVLERIAAVDAAFAAAARIEPVVDPSRTTVKSFTPWPCVAPVWGNPIWPCRCWNTCSNATRAGRTTAAGAC